MSELCWKCKEYYKEVIPSIPWIHCHHEPKKKEKCWCDYSKDVRNNWNVSIRCQTGEPQVVWPIIHCPVCGRKL